MEHKNYWTTRASRRRFVGGAGAAALGAAGLGLVGCGDDDDGGSNTPSGGGASPAGSATTGATSAPATREPTDGSYYHTNGASTTFLTQDAHRELLPNSSSIMSYAYSKVVTYDDPDKGTIRGDIAATVPEQPDPATYVFTLSPDIKWQKKAPLNGRAFTIDDLKWNFERQMAAKDFSGKDVKDFYRNSGIYKYVDKVEAVDATHLKVTLKAPRPIWLDAMCNEQNLLMSREAAELIEPNLNKPNVDLVIGTGPYVFTQFEPGKRVIAERNPEYFRKKRGDKVQFFDKIVQTDLGMDPNPIRIAFEQKNIDQFQSPVGQIIKDVQAATKARLIETPDPNTNFTLAASMVNEPFKSNMQVRQAVHLALDRQQVVQLIFEGRGRVHSVVPFSYTEWALTPEELEKTPGFRSDKTQDLKDAKAMWEAGGGPALGEISLNVNEVATWQQASVHEWLPAMLNKNLGTSQFKAVYLPTASVLPHIAGPSFNTLLCNWVIWTSPDPRQRMSDDFTPGGALNFPRFDNAELTAMSAKALAEFDVKKAQEYVREAQRIANKYAGAGKFHMASGVRNTLQHPYLQWKTSFIGYSGPIAQVSWIDQKDPSFASRPKLF